MEKNLKLSITIGNSTVAIEGDAESVISMFNDIRLNGFGEIGKTQKNALTQRESNIMNEGDVSNIEKTPTDSSYSIDTEENSLPSLQDLVIKLDGYTEAEWILVYCLYLSNVGSNTFTNDEVRSKYKETNRFTQARSKNLSTNVKKLIKANYISAINTKDYKMTQQGLEMANNILSNNIKQKKDKT